MCSEDFLQCIERSGGLWFTIDEKVGWHQAAAVGYFVARGTQLLDDVDDGAPGIALHFRSRTRLFGNGAHCRQYQYGRR